MKLSKKNLKLINAIIVFSIIGPVYSYIAKGDLYFKGVCLQPFGISGDSLGVGMRHHRISTKARGRGNRAADRGDMLRGGSTATAKEANSQVESKSSGLLKLNR